MDTSLFKKWWLVTLKGIFIIALGAALLVNPYTTTQAVVIFFGGTLLAAGFLITYFAYSNRHSIKSWKWFLAEGILELIAGLLLLLFPATTLYVIILLCSAWVIFLGLFQIAFGIQFKEEIKGWKYNIAYGILSILIGLVIVIYPMSGIIGFAVVFGITMVAFGIFLVLSSQRMRKHINRIQNN